MSISWSFRSAGPSKSASELRSLVSNKETPFIDVIQHESVKDEFRRQDLTLLNYLQNHLKELTNAALGIDTYDYPLAQATCFSFMITQLQSFTKTVSQHSDFLIVMHDCLFQTKEFTPKMAAAFTRIFQFMVQFSAPAFLGSFPEKELVFRHLVNHATLPQFGNLLQFLTDNGDPRVMLFLEENSAISVLLEALENIPQCTLNLTDYIINIIASTEKEIGILQPLLDPNILEMFLTRGLTSPDTHISAASFNVILQLCSHIEEDNFDNVEESPLQSVIAFVTGCLPRVCDFIRSDRPFLDAKYHCVELVAGISLLGDTVPAEIYPVCQYLFEEVLRCPAHTFLHRSFFTLFDAIFSDDPEVDDLIDASAMHERIADVFKRRKEILASYWNYLFDVAKLIASRGTVDEAWIAFLETEYDAYTHAMNTDRQYGGPLPDEFDEFEEDFDEFEEDIEYEEDAAGNLIRISPAKETPREEEEEEDEEEEDVEPNSSNSQSQNQSQNQSQSPPKKVRSVDDIIKAHLANEVSTDSDGSIPDEVMKILEAEEDSEDDF